ncbi:MAG: 50S ribosomal protein L31 [Candidatus Gracilibacteria bacterium]
MAKKDLHPEFHFACKVTCSCGATHTIGSTKEEMKVEICSKCHPFYTGKQKLVDTEGRVDKFMKRMANAQQKKEEEAAEQAAA